MSFDWSKILVTPGSSSAARLPAPLRRDAPALRPGDLALALVTAAKTAPDPWDRLLRDEPALVAAEVMSFRLDDEVMGFDFALEDGPMEAAKRVKLLASELSDWLARIRIQHGARFEETLDALDRQMNLSNRVAKLVKSPAPRLMGAIQQQGFVAAGGQDAVTQAKAMHAGLSAAHRQMMHAIGSLQPAARQAFEARITSGDIEPAVGLILAELAMTDDVDARLNLFGRRHTDFYYSDIIGQERRGAPPERALLHLPSGAVPQFVPKGSGVLARLEDGTKVRFETETDVAVSPAKVTATGALTYVTDLQNSIAASMGAITDVRATIEPADAQPLKRRVFSAPAAQPFDVGLDIASEMFDLAEGKRVIGVALHMDRATDLPAASIPATIDANADPDPNIELELRADPELVDAMGLASRKEAIEIVIKEVQRVALTRHCGPSMDLLYEVMAGWILDEEPLRLLLGRIMTLSLLEDHPWPTGPYWDLLETKILARKDALTGKNQRKTSNGEATRAAIEAGAIIEAFSKIDGAFIYSPSDIYQKLLGDAFSITLSTADGSVTATTTQFTRLDAIDASEDPDAPSASRAKRVNAGFKILLTLDEDIPALVPPAETDQTAPVVSIRWNQAARACPVSFFERYTLDAIRTTVAVAGVRKVAAFNDDGAVAPAQSFLPFGARPSDGSTFTISAPEMATKPVTQVRLKLEWADLPPISGGFEAHYAHYPKDVTVPEPKVVVDYLAADGWKSVLETPYPLFHGSEYDGKLGNIWDVHVAIPGITFPAVPGKDAKLPKTRDAIKAGAIRLTLHDAGDFGQNVYPLALVDAMRPRLVPFKPRKIPAAPYLPKVSSLRLSYLASATMELAASDSARPGDRVTQVTPFGKRVVFPSRIHRDFGLFPRRLGKATLYVQLAGPGSKRRLGLLFDIADSGHQRIAPHAVALHWHYLTKDGWVELPETSISSDTTDGLTKSGVVMLDLPDDAETPDGEMPEGGVWVAASTSSEDFETHPVLSHVRTNGVWAVRAAEHEDHAQGPREWRFELPKPGMIAPVEASRRAPPRPAESRIEYLSRVSERLRHRKRAVTPYDVERLVIEAFPDVWLAKCLPHLTRDTPTPRPGCATVVITRHPPDDVTSSPEARLFDAGTLNKVQAFLERHGPHGVRYHVVNPAFDRIQVRAAIRFIPFRDDGALAHQLRHHLADNLSVWTATDTLGQFGWNLQVPMLRAQIAALDYVVDVTDFSVLHFMVDDEPSYRLADTAKHADVGSVIRPSRPWALALSASDHAISTIEANKNIIPTPTGIGRLRVGDMLIVDQEARQ